MIPSIFGMASTRVKYDLLYYLPEELDTIKGQNILMEDFGKGRFSLCITEGIKRKSIKPIWKNPFAGSRMSIRSSATLLR